MCKLAIIPFIPKGAENKVFKLSHELTKLMCANDQDGFGYMALGDKGLFGERWLDPKHAWEVPSLHNNLSQYALCLDTPGTGSYNKFGDKTNRLYSIALHARMSTCDVSLDNVHPFINESGRIGIVHNGVITNANQYKPRLSTCDSESILHQYEKHSVSNNFDSLQNAVDGLDGWFDVAAYTRNVNNVWHLDIFKESKANLFMCNVDDIGPIFITAPHHLINACAKLKMKHSPLIKVSNNVAIRHDAMTGKVIDIMDIIPSNTKITPYNKNDWSYPPSSYREGDQDNPEKFIDDELDESDDDMLDVVDFMRNPHGVHVKKGA